MNPLNITDEAGGDCGPADGGQLLGHEGAGRRHQQDRGKHDRGKKSGADQENILHWGRLNSRSEGRDYPGTWCCNEMYTVKQIDTPSSFENFEIYLFQTNFNLRNRSNYWWTTLGIMLWALRLFVCITDEMIACMFWNMINGMARSRKSKKLNLFSLCADRVWSSHSKLNWIVWLTTVECLSRR